MLDEINGLAELRRRWQRRRKLSLRCLSMCCDAPALTAHLGQRRRCLSDDDGRRRRRCVSRRDPNVTGVAPPGRPAGRGKSTQVIRGLQSRLRP
jgi:hypothetical protein